MNGSLLSGDHLHVQHTSWRCHHKNGLDLEKKIKKLKSLNSSGVPHSVLEGLISQHHRIWPGHWISALSCHLPGWGIF